MKKRGWLLDRVYKRVKGDRGGSVSREGHPDIDSLVAEGFAAERTSVRSTKKISQEAREPRNTELSPFESHLKIEGKERA